MENPNVEKVASSDTGCGQYLLIIMRVSYTTNYVILQLLYEFMARI